jgi:hypothetical protein
MEKLENRDNDVDISISGLSTLDLKGKQSVRATFRLSEACIDAISILATQLGIKQKSIFDHLMEDRQGLDSLASELENTKIDRQKHVQKTFVISRRSISFLNNISSKYNAPRDALVEFSVRRLLPIIELERRKHKRRKELLEEISDHLATGQKLLATAEKALGPDDYIVDKLKAAISSYRNAHGEIADFIAKGSIIDNYRPAAFNKSRGYRGSPASER